MVLCVYALTSAPKPHVTSTAGIAREPLRTVRSGRITAIVSLTRRPPSPDEASLRRFDLVIRRLFPGVPALLPARFGTCFDSVDELMAVLRLRRAALARSLRLVRGRAQMTVRVVTGRQTPAPVPEGTAVTSGAAYLRRRAADGRHVPGFDPVRARVRRWIRDERVERRAGVATIYHLVPRAAASSYREAVERWAAATGLQCTVTGPWPPYAFADW